MNYYHLRIRFHIYIYIYISNIILFNCQTLCIKLINLDVYTTGFGMWSVSHAVAQAQPSHVRLHVCVYLETIYVCMSVLKV